MTSAIFNAALALGQWIELSILMKATIILALGLGATWLAGRARASVRCLFVASTFAMLLALPLLVITGPRLTIAIPTGPTAAPEMGAASSGTLAPPTVTSPADPASNQPRSIRPPLAALARMAWIAGALLLWTLLAVDFRRLRRLVRNGLPWPERRHEIQTLAAECGVRRRVEVLLHEEIVAPLTCGAWRPAIVLPADARDWSEADLRRALVHEFEHVRRGDWIMQIVARAISGLYWFHPLIWVAWRRLGLEAERACDDAVLRQAESTDYADQLVSLARRMWKAPAHAAPGMANRGDLSARVYALLDSGQRRGRAGLAAALSAFGIASLAVLAIAPLTAVAQPARRTTALDRALFEAAQEGELPDIEQLLRAGANVNCAIDGDGSPLIAAARNGKFTAARMLLDRGADVNMPVPGDGNPLIMAAREGHIDIVSLLLDNGARIDEAVPSDENALIQASGRGQLAVVKLLVSRGANVNILIWVDQRPNSEWRSPLRMARRGRHDAVAAYLISVGARE